MYLEQEAYALIKGGFICIMAIAVIVFALLYWKSKNINIFWFCGQIAFLMIAFHFFFACITYLPNQGNAMYTEGQTLTIAYAGLCWAASMFLMLIGIYKLIRKKDAVNQS